MDLSALVKQLETTQWEKRKVPKLKNPILTRSMLQEMIPPKGDFVAKTSGATGIPVEVQRTHLSQLWWSATNIREVLWHKRDISESFAIIRPHITKEIVEPQWGPAFSLLGRTGPVYAHPAHGDINQWLQKIQPGYLFTFPSILETIDLNALTNLKGIKTTGETLHMRHPLIADMYSTEEVGTVAIQCPDNREVYHVMENIILEILDENNQPATKGRVIVTDLASQYLYRYDIGDYAEFGTCGCGRGLQTIKTIYGRKRNMVRLPDGSTHWPRIGSKNYRDVAPVKRFQMAQVGEKELELRLVIDRPLTDGQKKKILALTHEAIAYPFKVRYKYVDGFAAGKFEEFVNEYQLE